VDTVERVRTRRRRWPRVLVVIVVLLVLAAVPTVWERVTAGPYLRDLDSVPRTPVALVFGAKADGDRPSVFLAQRLDAAVRLYDSGRVGTVLVSGNDDHRGYDEPGVMRAYLIRHGVPAGKITVDQAGYDTWDTCLRAYRVFGVRQATLVTQAFHVPRAVALCRANGVDGYGVGLASASVGLNSTVYGYLREFGAAVKAMPQALISGS
jgi:vancomycin permeability regulator SanA